MQDMVHASNGTDGIRVVPCGPGKKYPGQPLFSSYDMSRRRSIILGQFVDRQPPFCEGGTAREAMGALRSTVGRHPPGGHAWRAPISLGCSAAALRQWLDYRRDARAYDAPDSTARSN